LWADEVHEPGIDEGEKLTAAERRRAGAREAAHREEGREASGAGFGVEPAECAEPARESARSAQRPEPRFEGAVAAEFGLGEVVRDAVAQPLTVGYWAREMVI